MPNFVNNMRGALFKNEKAKDTDSDYGGSAEVAGVQYWLNAWINTDKAGRKFMSLRFKPKTATPQGAPPPPKPTGAEFDDEIPF